MKQTVAIRQIIASWTFIHSVNASCFFYCILQAEKMVLAVEDCVQFREEVQTTLDDLIQGQKEAQAEFTKILDCPTHREAQQLLLIHQVL